MELQKVLIADSSDDFLIAMTLALQTRFHVLCCQDGNLALELLRREHCQLMILDLMLPELDGITLLEKAAAEGLSPVVLATTLLVNDYIEQALQRLSVHYLVRKPCDVSAVAARILDLSGQLPAADRTQEDRRFLSEILQNLSLSPKHKGFADLVECILRIAADPSIPFTKELYPEVGKRTKRGGNQVERSIRSALDYAWKQPGDAVWQQYFPPSEKRPTSSDFIIRIAQLLRQRRE